MPETGPRYLRLSVTGRCALRCVYCGGASPCEVAVDRVSDLCAEDFAFLVQAACDEGVRKVRLTGGEPLERADLKDVVRALRGVPGVEELTLTTNGIGLAERARGLRDAGLDRVNVSLDTLSPQTFARITGAAGAQLDRVLDGIEAAQGLFRDVKINSVLLAPLNSHEARSLVEYAGARGLGIRFIERYATPGDEAGKIDALSGVEIAARLEDELGPLEALPAPLDSPERLYRAAGAPHARIGLIEAASAPGCADCRKVRLTTRGELQGCLFAPEGPDAIAATRARDIAALRRAFRRAFGDKPGPGMHHTVGGPVRSIGG